MKSKRAGWILGLIVAVIGIAVLPVAAQDETSTGVARVSLIQGDVTTQRADSGTWVSAIINTPLVPGDTIATGAGARAEVQLDYADVVRLDQNTEVKIADLTRSRIQLQVARGLVDYVVVGGAGAASEVDTPNVAVEPSGTGVFRIDVNSAELSDVTVRKGEAQVATPQGSTTVNSGQQITIQGTQNPEYQIADAQALDGWDRWNSGRNQTIERAQNYEHVNQYYTGAQDLDSQGHWVQVPNYDWCWTPYVDAGWVPYSDGSWVWEPYWGWTWVSYEPWGWAPYHYGRWFLYDNEWCWWPGYVTAGFYPVWAPAYVSFLGFGYGRFGFGFGFGWGFRSIGWCPLGPRDRFYPWYGRGHSFNTISIVDARNVTFLRDRRGVGRGLNGSNIQTALTNERVRRSITVVPADRFGAGRVSRTGRTVTAADLRSANVVRGTLPVVPTRASLSASSRPARVPTVAQRTGSNVRFFSRHGTSSVPRPVSFTSQTASIRQMMQDHVQQSAVRAGARQSVLAGTNARQVNRSRVAESSRGSAQVGRRMAPRTATRSSEPQRQGWRHFGAPAAQPQAGARGRQSWPAGVNFGTHGRTNSPAEARRNSPVSSRSAPRNRGPQTFNSRQSPARANSPAARPGWHEFTSRPRPQNTSPDQGRGREFSRPAPNTGARQGGWTRFSPEPAPRSNYNSRGYRRPPLELNRPIVNERQPRYSESPRYSPRYSTPRYSVPRYSAPRYSAPRYSAPRYSAPAREAPHSYSAPSRGNGGGRGRSRH
jgi:Family of unknown function (DUF6600)/FecR protein